MGTKKSERRGTRTIAIRVTSDAIHLPDGAGKDTCA
jgi:hypothetical protein